MPEIPTDYGLVVGINDYPSFKPLKGAIGDAQDVRAWLTDTTVGGGIPDEQCGHVYSTPNPVKPDHEMIDNELQRLVALAEKNGNGRRFYLYFSGHGIGSGYSAGLCLATWSDVFRTRALETPTYADYLRNKGLFTEIIVILDCCRVKKVEFKGLPCAMGPIQPAPTAGDSRQFTGFATQSLAGAFEAEFGETTGADGAVVRGHFTRALLEGLYGACASPTGGVTATALKNYLETETPVIANDAGHVQKPEVGNGLLSAPDPVFGFAMPITQATVNFKLAPRPGDVVLEKRGLALVRQGPSNDPGWTGLSLTPGLYSLSDSAGTPPKNFQVRKSWKEIDVAF